MKRKFFKFFAIAFLTLSFAFLCCVGALLFRLRMGPVSLNRFLPVLSQKAMQSVDGLTLSIGDARLVWDKWSRPVHIEISELHVSKKDSFVADVPRTAVVFRLLSLLRGKVAPRRLAVFDPKVDIVLNAGSEQESGEEKAPAETEEEPLLPAIADIFRRHTEPTRFQILNARIGITDQANNSKFNFPSFSISYVRRFGRYKVTADFTAETAGRPIHAALSARWRSHAAFVPIKLLISDVDLKKLRGAEKYPLLNGVSVPLTLALSLQIDTRPFRYPSDKFQWHDILRQASFTLTGTEGDIVLPRNIGGYYDVASFKIDGEWNKRDKALSLPAIAVDLRRGAKLRGNFKIDNVNAALTKKNPALLNAVLTATAENFSIDQARDYWPRSSIPDVYDWVVGNVKEGVVPNASLYMALGDDGTGFGVTKLDITHGLRGVVLTYMDGMPVVTDADGKIDYSLTDIVISIYSAKSAGLVSRHARAAFTGLDRPVTYFDLSVPLEVADLSDAMAVVLSPGLGLTRQTTQIGPENLSGPATGLLKLTFPLKDDLKPEDVAFSVDAKTDKAAFKGYPFDFIALQDVDADLFVNEKGLTLTADALAREGAVHAELFQDFTGQKDVSTDLAVTGQVTDAARKDIGVDYAAAPYVVGTIPARFLLRFFKNGTGEATADADLTPAAIDFPMINWVKKAETGGTARLKMMFENNALKAIPDITVSDKAGNIVKTSMDFAPDGNIARIDVPVLVAGKTDLKARIRFNVKGKNRIDANGLSLDLSQLIKKQEKSGDETEKEINSDKDEPNKNADEALYVINAVFNKVWLSDSAAEDNAFAAVLKGGAPQRIDATGKIGEKRTPFRFKFYPDPKNNESAFAFTSDDAGSLMKLLGSMSTVKGGKIKIKGQYDTEKGASGLLEIEDFRLEEQPLLTRLLRLTSFTGLIDTLTGKGLHFEKAEAQFVHNDGILTVNDGLVAGSSLGITLEGSYNGQKSFLNLTGTMMPFYGVNGLVGKVPLVGKMLTGEKGGGLIGVSYKIEGVLPTPEISVNPLSAVAPGVIRKLVPNIF